MAGSVTFAVRTGGAGANTAAAVLGGDVELQRRLSEDVLAEIRGFVFYEAVCIERRHAGEQARDGFVVGAKRLGRGDLPLTGIAFREVQLFPALLLDCNLGNVFLLQEKNFGWSIEGSLRRVLGRRMMIGPLEHAGKS